MAYEFASASSQYLSVDSSPVANYPCTMATWYRVNSESLGANMALMAFGASANTSRININYNGTTSPRRAVQVTCNNTANTQGNITFFEQTISANTWYHAAVVLASSTDVIAYFNGSPSFNGGTGITVSSLDRITIGVRRDTATSTLSTRFDGLLADSGIWNVALTAAEIASLAKGIACDKVRPQSLVFYAPLARDLIDVRGGRTITNNNTATVANHTRIYQ
jgi:hypothetical protein